MPTCPFCTRGIPDESSICPHCLRAQPITIPTARKATVERRQVPPLGRLLVLLLVLGATGGYAFMRYRPRATPVDVSSAAPSTITIAPLLQLSIADSSMTIMPREYAAFEFDGGGRSTCHVQGAVRGLSGDHLVNVLIVDRDGLSDLEQGRSPRTYFQSGAVVSTSPDINVDGRTHYTLVVANPSSRGKAKAVRVRVGAECRD